MISWAMRDPISKVVFPRMKPKVILLALQGHSPILPTPVGICTHPQHSPPDRIQHRELNNRKSERLRTRTHQQKSSVSFSPWFCRALEQSLHSLKHGSDTLHLSGFWNNPGERSPVTTVLEARRKAGLLMFVAYYLSNVTWGLQRGCWSNSTIN